MKKYLFFLLTLPALSFGQWTENFDASTTLPAGWAVINNGDPNGWFVENLYAQSGANSARISYDPSAAHDDYLITKSITVTPGISDRISFYVISTHSIYLENYEVLLSTANQTKAAFTNILQSTQKAPDNWTKLTFDLSAYSGQTVYVAVHATDTNQDVLLTDTFVVDSASSLSTSETKNTTEKATIFPNPFKDIVHISDITKVKSISISDISGRLIKTIDKPVSDIHLAELEQGVYLITLHQRDGSKQTIKAIKE